MIRVYDSSYTALEHLNSNGLKIIQPLKCIEHKSEDEWYLEVEVKDTYVDYIVNNNVIVVKTKEALEQPFRIANVKLDRHTFSFKAYHVFYELNNYQIKSLTFSNYNGQTLLNYIKSNTTPANSFTVSSNITTTVSGEYKLKSALEAILDARTKLGGFLILDNYTVTIDSSAGANRGVSIIEGKNLEGFTKAENWDNVVTTIIPKCGDRVYNEIVADVSYDIPYVRTIAFKSDAEGETAIEADVVAQATAYLNNNKYPKVNYTVKSDILQDVHINDTILVKGLYEINTRVLAYTFDVINQRVKSVEFGNFQPTLKNMFANYTKIEDINQRTDNIDQLVADQTAIINGLYKEGYLVTTDNELYLVDTLPKESATYVLRMNLGGIGFSSTGISGPYSSAWTLDGKFNADFIQAGSLNGITIKIGADNSVFKADSNGIYLGNDAFASAPFSVSMAGALKATSADITGKITASSGKIGTWNIGSDRLYAGTTSNYVGIAPGYTSGSYTYAMWAGDSSPGSADFSVQTNGTLTANAGKIGSWNLSADRLYAGSGTSYVGISPGYYSSPNYYSIWAGNSTPGSAPFYVTRDGKMNAESGTVGGWTLGTDKIYTGTGNTYMALDQTNKRLYFTDTIYLYYESDSYYPGVKCNYAFRGTTIFGNTLVSNGNVIPNGGNTTGLLGTSNNRWAGLWTTGGYYTYSDQRLKENIQPIQNGVDFILSVKPVEYKMKDGKRKHFGFIAQDIKSVIDSTLGDAAVFVDPSVKPDWDVNNPEENDKEHYLSLKYDEFIAPMVQTIQALHQRLKNLEELYGVRS